MNSLLTQTFKKLDVLSEKEQELMAERILLELQYLRLQKTKSKSKIGKKKNQNNDLKIINRKSTKLN